MTTPAETQSPAGQKLRVRKLTLCGSFGLGNTGDEALPFAVSDLARAHNIQLQMDLLSRYDETALASSVGLGKNGEKRRRQLAGRPCLIIGGGAVAPDRMSVLFRCGPYLRRIEPSHTSLFAAAVESGVEYPYVTRLKIAKLLKDAEPLTVRDTESAAVLKRILPKRKIELVGDCVLWLTPRGPIPERLEKLDRFVAVSLAGRWSNKPGWYAWIGYQLRRLAVRVKAPLVFVPFSWLDDDDRPEHRKVCEVLRFLYPEVEAHCVEEVLNPRQVASVLSRALLTVGMRLHACVMSFAMRVPFVALAYHPKIYGFAKTVGWDDFMIPRYQPEKQSQRTYGYAFSDIRADESLEATAVEALEFSSFGKLDELRERLAESFMDFLNRETQ